MDLKSGEWEFRRCDIHIDASTSSCYFGVSREWSDEDIAMIISKYIRDLRVSEDQNALDIPMEIHNMIAKYFHVQEFLHYMEWDRHQGVHFAVSIEDLLLATF